MAPKVKSPRMVTPKNHTINTEKEGKPLMEHTFKQRTVGSLVAEEGGRVVVLEKYGIDYCCGGDMTLEAACMQEGIEIGLVTAELEKHDSEASKGDGTDWLHSGTKELIENIVATHHVYLKEELPRLSFLVNKVASVHGERHPYLQGLSELYRGLSQDLESHLFDEEENIFPMLRLISSSGNFDMLVSDATGAIEQAKRDHQSVGDCIHQIRAMTGGYQLPADGCETFRLMLTSLERLESDTHRHVHKENNILFPKLLERAV